MRLLSSATCTIYLIFAPDQLGRKLMYHNIGEAYYPNLYILLSAHFIFASCHITFQCGYVALRNAVFEPILVTPVSKFFHVSTKSTIHCICICSTSSICMDRKIISVSFFKKATQLFWNLPLDLMITLTLNIISSVRFHQNFEPILENLNFKGYQIVI